MTSSRHPDQTGCKTRARTHPRWREQFLLYLEQTSCVTRSAEHAGVSTARAYRARRTEPEFANAWLAALARGYEHLELEVLRRLREGDLLAQGESKYDLASAIRLLRLHRDTVLQAHADERNVTPAEIRASIDRKIAEIRQRIASDYPASKEVQ